jgi:hypothetical protein
MLSRICKKPPLPLLRVFIDPMQAGEVPIEGRDTEAIVAEHLL